MSYLRITLILLSFFFQNVSFVAGQSFDLLRKTQKGIDSIVNNAIQHHAFPGAVVFASVGDSILVNSAYGFHKYDSVTAVELDHLYDLASLTKVMGSGLALMKLYEEGLIELDKPLKTYVSGLKTSKIGRLTIRQCLAHQSGLPGWIPFYKKIQRKKGGFRPRSIADNADKRYVFELAQGMYLHDSFQKKIKRYIKKAKVNKNPDYQYSGIFFYLIPEIVKNTSGMRFEDFLDFHFYRPLSAESVLFNPLNKFDLDLIVPTEIDSFFRFSPIHGRVHDEGAILMSGVSGNAGLFGNVYDIAQIWRMLLNNGTMNDIEFLKPSTIQLFTSYQFPQSHNRRGLAFDKPLIDYDPDLSSVAESSSILSYGHTGYTGTLVWADPKYELLYIFLSNRVFPNRDQKAIYELNVRPSIHQMIYDYVEQSSFDD